MSVFLDGQPDPVAVLAALSAGAVKSAFLLELKFNSGTIYVSDMNIPFIDPKWGHTWKGMGELVGMSEISASEGDLAPLREYVLGIPWEFLTDGEQAVSGMWRVPGLIGNKSDFIGREANLFMQLFDVDANDLVPVGVPFALDSGLMDKVSASMTASAAVLTLRVEGLLARKGAPIYGIMTDRDQQKRHPGDRGLEQIVEVNGTNVVWTDW